MSQDQKDDRPHGWCTVLVGGMRFGGGSIDVSGDFDNDGTDDSSRDFASSYFAIDVTDPLKPILLWERNYPGLGFTTSFPAVLKVDKKSIDTSTDPDTINVLERHCYLLFGSGPSGYGGTSTQSSSVFLVDLANGQPVLIYDVDPSNWTLSHMFDADYAITATPSVAVGTVDSQYSLWIYAGTGHYLTNSDKVDTTQQYLYGIKDPYYNPLENYKDEDGLRAKVILQVVDKAGNTVGEYSDETAVEFKDRKYKYLIRKKY